MYERARAVLCANSQQARARVHVRGCTCDMRRCTCDMQQRTHCCKFHLITYTYIKGCICGYEHTHISTITHAHARTHMCAYKTHVYTLSAVVKCCRYWQQHQPHKHTHTCTHTRAHAHTHTHTHTRTHNHTHTHIHTHTHSHTHKCTHTTHARTCTHIHTHALSLSLTHTHAYRNSLVYIKCCR